MVLLLFLSNLSVIVENLNSKNLRLKKYLINCGLILYTIPDLSTFENFRFNGLKLYFLLKFSKVHDFFFFF